MPSPIVAGILPMVAISYEVDPCANRVTSRRWPNVTIEKDVGSLTAEVVQSWRYLYPEVEEIHLWARWPCADLLKVKFGRLNLEGEQSGWFWEIIRIVKTIKQIYGFSFPLKFVAENVASMDASAEAEIYLGEWTQPMWPLYADPGSVGRMPSSMRLRASGSRKRAMA